MLRWAAAACLHTHLLEMTAVPMHDCSALLRQHRCMCSSRLCGLSRQLMHHALQAAGSSVQLHGSGDGPSAEPSHMPAGGGEGCQRQRGNRGRGRCRPGGRANRRSQQRQQGEACAAATMHHFKNVQSRPAPAGPRLLHTVSEAGLPQMPQSTCCLACSLLRALTRVFLLQHPKIVLQWMKE